MAQTSIPPSTINNRTCKSWSHVTYMATPPLQRGRKKYFTPLQKNKKKGQTARSSSLPFPISIILQNPPLHNKKRFDFGAENLYTYMYRKQLQTGNGRRGENAGGCFSF